MEEIQTGIIIKKQIINHDDEIITLLTRDEIITLISLGSKKENSKNALSLDYGNLINVEFFRARLNNKISKLKKATIISKPNLLISDTSEVIMEIIRNINNLKTTSSILFDSILETISYFGDKYNHHIKTYITFRMFHSIGIYPITWKCVDCQRKNKIIDFNFDEGGFKCSIHSNRNRDIHELEAFNDLSQNFSIYKNTSSQINKKIYEEIIYTLNKYIWKIK